MIIFATLASLSTLADDPADWRFIDNGSLRLGVIMSSGAGIGWLSRSGDTNNIVNHFDRGRLIQQSYYGRKDGSLWAKKDWRWNPVQGGSWEGKPAKVLAVTNSSTSLYARTLPRHWATGEEIKDALMEEWISLTGMIAHVRFRFIYKGTISHPAVDHEIPAFFFNPRFDTLVVYDGASPWTGQQVSRSQPGWPNESRRMTEHWAAYVDKSGYGGGAFVPDADRLTCYRFGFQQPHAGSCSYFAPLKKFAVTPGLDFSYNLYLTVGAESEIRSRFRDLGRRIAGKR